MNFTKCQADGGRYPSVRKVVLDAVEDDPADHKAAITSLLKRLGQGHAMSTTIGHERHNLISLVG